jgi:type VI secretion system protein VasG
MADNHGVALSYDSAVSELIASRCTELESGARMIDSLLSNTLLPGLSQALLGHILSGTKVQQARVLVERGEFAYTLQ